ncbi:hypothetical protein F5887DRAFT_1161439, partial [Amanita rubescens]
MPVITRQSAASSSVMSANASTIARGKKKATTFDSTQGEETVGDSQSPTLPSSQSASDAETWNWEWEAQPRPWDHENVRRFERMMGTAAAKLRNADALGNADAGNRSTQHESPSQEVENQLQHNRRSPELDALHNGQGDHIPISSDTEMDLDANVPNRNSGGEASNCCSTRHESSSPEIVNQRVLSLRERARLQLNRSRNRVPHHRLSRFHKGTSEASSSRHAVSNAKSARKMSLAGELHLHIYGPKSTMNINVNGTEKKQHRER